jgi:glycosyltransferase involved in cell wall biosynthesis
MRILYVHNEYACRSGEESAAEAIAELLTSYGHEVIWHRRSSVGIGGSVLTQARAFCAGIHNPFASRAMARTLDRVKPDLVQIQNLYPWFSPSILGPIRKRGIPIVMRCPNYRLFCPNGLHLVNGQVCEKCLGFGREAWCILKRCETGFFKSTGYALRGAWARISGAIVRNVDMFIVQTRFQKRRFVEQGIPDCRIGVVPGFVPCNGHAKGSTQGSLVSFIGRISHEKGIEDLLAAARVMPEVPFAVAGGGDQRDGVYRNSPENVRWLGFLGTAQLRDLYRRSRIVVVPSRCFESFPNSLIEAMAHGCPVVASRTGAMASIVDDQTTGLLFDTGDPHDLAERLRVLYFAPELCRALGEAGRQKAMSEYSPIAAYDALMAVYEDAALRIRTLKGCLSDQGSTI